MEPGKSRNSRKEALPRGDMHAAPEAGRGVAERLIDLERYPIADSETSAFRSVVKRCRDAIRQDGYCLMPAFLTPDATRTMVEQAGPLLPSAWFCSRTHNAYLIPDDPSFPEEDPRRRLLRTRVGSVAHDRLPQDGLLCRLYAWDPLVRFIGAVLEKGAFYRLADPLGALSINVFTDGGAHAWHFDESEYTTTIMLQAADRGGHFECVPWIRPAEGEDHDAVGRVLDGRVEEVRRLEFEPGTLSIFGGRRSIHRVTEIKGERPRLVAVLCYGTEPDILNSDLVRELFWGRTG